MSLVRNCSLVALCVFVAGAVFIICNGEGSPLAESAPVGENKSAPQRDSLSSELAYFHFLPELVGGGKSFGEATLEASRIIPSKHVENFRGAVASTSSSISSFNFKLAGDEGRSDFDEYLAEKLGDAEETEWNWRYEITPYRGALIEGAGDPEALNQKDLYAAWSSIRTGIHTALLPVVQTMQAAPPFLTHFENNEELWVVAVNPGRSDLDVVLQMVDLFPDNSGVNLLIYSPFASVRAKIVNPLGLSVVISGDSRSACALDIEALGDKQVVLAGHTYSERAITGILPGGRISIVGTDCAALLCAGEASIQINETSSLALRFGTTEVTQIATGRFDSNFTQAKANFGSSAASVLPLTQPTIRCQPHDLDFSSRFSDGSDDIDSIHVLPSMIFIQPSPSRVTPTALVFEPVSEFEKK